jgi:hypothetical protein
MMETVVSTVFMSASTNDINRTELILRAATRPEFVDSTNISLNLTYFQRHPVYCHVE